MLFVWFLCTNYLTNYSPEIVLHNWNFHENSTSSNLHPIGEIIFQCQLQMFRKQGHTQVWLLETFEINKLRFGNIKLVNFQINVLAESEILKQKKSKIMKSSFWKSKVYFGTLELIETCWNKSMTQNTLFWNFRGYFLLILVRKFSIGAHYFVIFHYFNQTLVFSVFNSYV